MTRRTIQEPEVTVEPGPGSMECTVTRHPAFGQIQANRVSGVTHLYGSDFTHHTFIRLHLRRSEQRRDLSRDWHYAREELFDVDLSEAQWASFVSAMNVGMGTPCTIRRVVGDEAPGLPAPPARHTQFTQEARQAMADSVQELRALRDAIAASGLSKKKADDLLHRLNIAESKLASSVPFIAEQFGEFVQDTTEKARTEVHAYVHSAIQRTGLAALQGQPLPFQLPDRSAEE